MPLPRDFLQRLTLRRVLLGAGAAYAVAVAALFASTTAGCQRTGESPQKVAARPLSADCRSCHEDIYKDWAQSHHAHAHRPVDPVADAEAFMPAREFSLHGVDYHVGWKEGRPAFTETRPGAEPEHYVADYTLAYTPLQQYIVPVGRGHYQATELAWDPVLKEWFNVFGDEQRQPGEWGQWRGRGMNWNSMCAHCHITEFRKNYNAATDTYSSAWREHGVGCIQCHGDLPPEHMDPNRKRPTVKQASLLPQAWINNRQLAQETCAPCHARNELLTGDLIPGVRYHDHYRLTLPVDPQVFYPDGQVLDEDFNYTSLLISRMGAKAGVTCLDCHEPHSGRPRLPVENNALCMSCHTVPGPQNAPVIHPLEHTRHAPDNAGHLCVSCHMPKTTYMQRDPRHDHGFLKPDPLLTKELGIPNACNRCHTDKSVDWAIEHSDAWYGDKMNSRQRERARVVAAAQSGAPDAANRLLDMIANEDIPAWKATLILLSRPYAGTDRRFVEVATAATTDPDAMVRSAAAQVLGPLPAAAVLLRPLLDDPARLVRLDAAWALSPELPDGSRARRELDAYLAVSADQPTGRLRIAQDLFNRGRTAEAVAPLRTAVEWDPNSAGIHETLGIVLDALGRSGEAAASLWRAAQLNPEDARTAFNAALAFAGARRLPDAELALREAVRRDPRFDRAWYNLGLLLAQTNRAPEGIQALERAESLAPDVADYPYARSTILWQRGDREAALAAARRTLEIDPNHTQARGLLLQAR
jgi:predicted CXXCH cytochrome family protein